MKNIVLFSVDKKVARYLKTAFEKIIGHIVKIHAISMEEGNFKSVQPDLVFLSGEFLRPKARALFPDIKIIAPTRVIVGQNLEKVLLLPRGHHVLVVNSPRQTSEETIESLNDLGLNHLNYIPFWKGRDLDFRKIQAAISPGMMHLCPDEIENRIDIGPRNVSIGSFLQILEALDLDVKYLENYSNEYHKMLLDSSHKLAQALMNTERLREQEKIIISEFDDGLICVNEENKINLVNRTASRFLKTPKEKLDGKDFDRIMAGFERLAVILEPSDTSRKTAAIHDINGEKTVVTMIPVTGENSKGRIYTLRGIESIRKLEKEVRVKLVKKGHVTKYTFSSIWTKNEKIKRIIEKARDFAATGKNILITAESGMGKELFAHAIHQASPLRNGPFVAVNFAGIVDSLIESELFGYEEGAFTGARKGGKKGLFEQARGGTIFLDEIGDAPLNVQSSLLRVLQEKEILRVGGSSIIPVEVRIIAATNKDVFQAMEEKKFRNDLFYRLNTFPINIPPLRTHKEDILYILHKYLKTRYGVGKTISQDAKDCLLSHDWPGNVRELINIAEYIFYSSKESPKLLLEHFPDTIRERHMMKTASSGAVREKDTHSITGTFAANGLSTDMVARLLTIINRRQGKLCGRNSLRRTLLDEDYQVSEGKIKKSLSLLRETGLILVGKTKQGTVITSQGEKYLEYLETTGLQDHKLG